jgi:ATP-dependent RNA helicase MSS116
MYGGYPVTKDLRRFKESPIDVLVATPGRLEDHIKNAPGVRERLSKGVSVLILDEADQLLEMGFRPAMERIIAILPKERQTLLLTATVPQQMHSVLNLAMRKDHEFIDCVGQTEEQTNKMVQQEFCVVPLARQLAALEILIRDHITKNAKTYKIIVFFTTARQAGLAAAMFEASGLKGVLAIHSRKSQAQRTKASDQFKNGTKLVLFSSDVSARGLDYPDVSLVIQVGTVEREQYIHRVGRTARAGASGQGVLLLSPWEQYMLKNVSDLPLAQISDPSLAAKLLSAQPSPGMQSALDQVARPNSELNVAAQQAYQAFLGFYKGHLGKMKMNTTQLVQLSSEYSAIMGLPEVPFLMKKTVGMMGLKGVPGLRVQ